MHSGSRMVPRIVHLIPRGVAGLQLGKLECISSMRLILLQSARSHPSLAWCDLDTPSDLTANCKASYRFVLKTRFFGSYGTYVRRNDTAHVLYSTS
jgi:hypothetical protein